MLTLLVTFGPEFRLLLREASEATPFVGEYVSVLDKTVISQVYTPAPISNFWSFLVSSVTLLTTFSTYGLGGAARHGKKGWRFFQPGAGGIRFVLVQIMTWVSVAFSVVMPWTNMKHFGFFTLSGYVEDQATDPASHRGLLVVGSAFGMLANTFCVIGLMSFNPSERSDRGGALETGRWKWNLLGDSKVYWWLFLILQGTFVAFAWELSVMLEMSSALKNNIVQSLILMVISAFLAIPMALTNAVAGKWKHGERKYKLTMPCQGGVVFVLLQSLGWTLFSGAFIGTLMKLWTTATMSDTQVFISSTASLGFVSYLCIVASLFVFDPTQVDSSFNEDGLDVEEEEESLLDGDHVQEKHAHSVLGKRSSPTVKGHHEYLVQWKAHGSPIWVLDDKLAEIDPDAISKADERTAATMKNTSSSKQDMRGRSRSPMLRRGAKHGYVDPVDHAHAQEDDDESETDEDSDEVWEEVEDEHGNVFFFNEKRNIAQTKVPKHLRQVVRT